MRGAGDANDDADDAKKKNEAPSSIPPPTIDSDDVIQNRLRMGHGIKGGTRGSLTRCAGLVMNFVKQQHADPSSTTTTTATTSIVSRDKLIREFEHLQLEMTKWILTTNRNEQELAAVQQHITTLQQKTVQEKEQVATKRAELQRQLHVTGCEREYDALAKIASSRHPISRKVLQQQLQQCQDTITTTQQELVKRKAQTAVRQGQFQLLMQCILDLKQSLNEPLDDVQVAVAAAPLPSSNASGRGAGGAGDDDDDDDGDGDGDNDEKGDDSVSEGQAMEIDQRQQQEEAAGKKKRSGSDDQDLYGDL